MFALNNKETKEVYFRLEEQFGVNNLDLDCFFYKNKENKLFLISKYLTKVDLTRFNVNSFGMYFGKIENAGLRLSISGTQIIGEKASKNIVEIENSEIWLNGSNLECDSSAKGWVIIKHKKDYLGCGYCKNGIIMNFIPKKH